MASTNAERTAAPQISKFMGFRLGVEEFGMELLKVREIIGLQKITRLPGAPAYVSGVINLRGKIIPVVSLRSKLGMPAVAENERTCIIVVDVTQPTGVAVQMGIVVDAVSEVLAVGDSDIESPPTLGADFDTKFILGIAKVKGAVRILISIQDIMTTSEVAYIAASNEAVA